MQPAANAFMLLALTLQWQQRHVHVHMHVHASSSPGDTRTDGSVWWRPVGFFLLWIFFFHLSVHGWPSGDVRASVRSAAVAAVTLPLCTDGCQEGHTVYCFRLCGMPVVMERSGQCFYFFFFFCPLTLKFCLWGLQPPCHTSIWSVWTNGRRRKLHHQTSRGEGGWGGHQVSKNLMRGPGL